MVLVDGGRCAAGQRVAIDERPPLMINVQPVHLFVVIVVVDVMASEASLDLKPGDGPAVPELQPHRSPHTGSHGHTRAEEVHRSAFGVKCP